MAFKDSAHTSDRTVAGLSKDSSGACKGPLKDVGRPCVGHLNHKLWCSYCKAKHPLVD